MGRCRMNRLIDGYHCRGVPSDTPADDHALGSRLPLVDLGQADVLAPVMAPLLTMSTSARQPADLA